MSFVRSGDAPNTAVGIYSLLMGVATLLSPDGRTLAGARVSTLLVGVFLADFRPGNKSTLFLLAWLLDLARSRRFDLVMPLRLVR